MTKLVKKDPAPIAADEFMAAVNKRYGELMEVYCHNADFFRKVALKREKCSDFEEKVKLRPSPDDFAVSEYLGDVMALCVRDYLMHGRSPRDIADRAHQIAERMIAEQAASKRMIRPQTTLH